jgi:hypothetical protein
MRRIIALLAVTTMLIAVGAAQRVLIRMSRRATSTCSRTTVWTPEIPLSPGQT